MSRSDGYLDLSVSHWNRSLGVDLGSGLLIGIAELGRNFAIESSGEKVLCTYDQTNGFAGRRRLNLVTRRAHTQSITIAIVASATRK